jgi:putative toxin-antitoxin system antitoxin component (TIGR02293 family)
MEAVLPVESSVSPTSDFAARESHVLHLSRQFLGGVKLFKRTVHTHLDVHEALLDGELQYASLVYLIDSFTVLDEDDLVPVLGISTRTLHRRKESPKKPMPPQLASQAWLFAETLAKASEVFGGKDKAEEWMSKPAMGLDGQRPLEMLKTAQGATLVKDFLTRLEYGVYS